MAYRLMSVVRLCMLLVAMAGSGLHDEGSRALVRR